MWQPCEVEKCAASSDTRACERKSCITINDALMVTKLLNQWTHPLPSSLLFISWLMKVRYCIAHYNVIRCEGETWYSKPMKSTCLNEELD
jgi:hypothetical protein